MKSKSFKILNAEEFNYYLKNDNGKLVPNPYFKHCNFYECDNNSLIIENKLEKKFTLYFDRNKYYKKMNNVHKMKDASPLKKDQALIKDIEVNKANLLNVFFAEIGMTQPSQIVDTDLKLLDQQLKQYGYQKAYENMLLQLIVFSGEFIRSKKGGKWIIENNKSYPSELTPIFIDDAGQRYDFDINIQIQKDFIERGRISIKEVVEFALLPKFKVGMK